MFVPSRFKRSSRSPIPKMWQCEIGQAGHDRLAGKIDNTRAIIAKRLDVGICADENDTVASHGNRFPRVWRSLTV